MEVNITIDGDQVEFEYDDLSPEIIRLLVDLQPDMDKLVTTICPRFGIGGSHE